MDKRTYQPKDYHRLLGMKGFSDELLENHFQLYQGYVKATNQLLAELGEMRRQGDTGKPAYSELKRRLGWEFNGMRLHEYYFENLGGKGKLDPEGKLATALSGSFDSLAEWDKDFRTTAAMRGIGWAVCYEDPATGLILNVWVNEHDVAHPAGASPLLILDVFEHAYMLDYGIKKDDYIAAFLGNVDWSVVEARLT